MKTLKIALAALAVTSTLSLHAAKQAEKLPLHVNCTAANDGIGGRFCTALRDSITRSPRFEDALSGTRFLVHVVTLDIADGEQVRKGEASVQAVTLTMDTKDGEVYMDTMVYQTGSSRVREQADRVLSNIDGDVMSLIDAYENTKEQ